MAALLPALAHQAAAGLLSVPFALRAEPLPAAHPDRARGKAAKKTVLPGFPTGPEKTAFLRELRAVVAPAFAGPAPDADAVFAQLSASTRRRLERLAALQAPAGVAFTRPLLPTGGVAADALDGTLVLDFDIYPCQTADAGAPDFFYYRVQGDPHRWSYEELFEHLVATAAGPAVRTLNGGLHLYFRHAGDDPLAAKLGMAAVQRVFPNDPEKQPEGVLDFPAQAFYAPPHYALVKDVPLETWQDAPPPALFELVLPLLLAQQPAAAAEQPRCAQAAPPAFAAGPRLRDSSSDSAGDRRDPVDWLVNCPHVVCTNKRALREKLERAAAEADAKSPDDLIGHLLARIRSDIPFASWNKVLMACANYEFPYERFDRWCAAAPNYDAAKNRALWDSAAAKRGAAPVRMVTAATLLRLAAAHTGTRAVVEKLRPADCFPYLSRVQLLVLMEVAKLFESDRPNHTLAVLNITELVLEHEFCFARDTPGTYYHRHPQLPYWVEVPRSDAFLYVNDVLLGLREPIDAFKQLYELQLETADDDARVARFHAAYAKFFELLYLRGAVSRGTLLKNTAHAPHTAAQLFRQKPHHYVAFRNVVVELVDGRPRTRAPAYKDHILDFLDYTLHPPEDCAREMRTLEALLRCVLCRKTPPGEAADDSKYAFMMTWMAHRLFGKKLAHSQVLNLIGDGRNGKGLFNKLMRQTFARHGKVVEKQHLFAREASPAVLDILHAEPRVLFASELDKKTLREEHYAQIKKFTSEEISTRALFSNLNVSKTLGATFVFESNDTLFDALEDAGMLRRFTCMHFPNKLFDNTAGAGYDPANPNHVDISAFPQLSTGMDDRHKSALFHLLLPFVHRDLPTYDADRDLVAAAVSPLQQVLDRWLPLDRYLADRGLRPQTWKEKLAHVHPSAILHRREDLWRAVCAALRQEAGLAAQLPSLPTFRKLCKTNTALINITTSRTKAHFGEEEKNFYPWVYPPHADYGCDA